MQDTPTSHSPSSQDMSTHGLQQATLGGGCFWCLEAVYSRVEGVQAVVSGYAGGSAQTADYKTVCSGTTRHAEVVQITFDPQVITYPELLKIFWTVHDPTTPNRQGNDVGPQYRSVIFFHDEAQREQAVASLREVAAELWGDKVVTELTELPEFFPAEDYHQGYYERVGSRNPYCSFVITPKVNKLRKEFAHRLKAKA